MKLATRTGHMLTEPPPPSPKEGTLLVLVSPLGTSRVPGPVLTRDTQQREQTGCLPLSGRSSYSEDGEGSKHAYGLNHSPQKGTLESSPPQALRIGRRPPRGRPSSRAQGDPNPHDQRPYRKEVWTQEALCGDTTGVRCLKPQVSGGAQTPRTGEEGHVPPATEHQAFPGAGLQDRPAALCSGPEQTGTS